MMINAITGMKPIRLLIIACIGWMACGSPSGSEETAETAATVEPLFTAPLGIQMYSYRNYYPTDMAGTLDRIKELGLTEVEGDGGSIAPEEFKKMCDERGIRIPATGADFGELENNPMAVVQKAQALGSKFVMCAWVPHNGDFTLADAEHAVKVFNASGKVLHDNGLILCYHAHGYEFQPFENGTLLDYIIQNTDPQNVSFEMDIFWVQFGGGDPVALMQKYGDRWKLLHLKDMKTGTVKDLTGGTSEENNVVLGTGELDMPGIMKEAKRIGIAHYFIEDESSAVLEQVPLSIAYLRNLSE